MSLFEYFHANKEVKIIQSSESYQAEKEQEYEDWLDQDRIVLIDIPTMQDRQNNQQ